MASEHGSGARGEAFVYHLLALHEARHSGVFTVRARDLTIDIYLRAGIPVFAEKNTLSGSLCRALLQGGVLDERQYEAVINRMTEELFESEQMRFAEVAVQLGFLTHEEVHVHLEQQVKACVVECMALVSPEVSFRCSDDALARLANYPCPVQPLVMHGVRSFYDRDRSEGVWRPDARAYAKLKRSAAETAHLFALKPNERRYISNIDGSKSVEELVHTGFLDTLHAGQVMAALLLADGVHLYRQPSLPPRTDQEAQPPPVAIQSDSVRRRLSSPLLRAVGPARSEPRSSLAQAAAPPDGALPDPDGIAPETTSSGSNSGSRQLRAEKLFILGKRLFKAESLTRASRMFASATELQPESVEYALYHQWTRFLLAPPNDARSALDELDELALRTLQQDRTLGFAHYVVGRVAHARGKVAQARGALKAALRCDPDLLEAKRFLRALVQR